MEQSSSRETSRRLRSQWTDHLQRKLKVHYCLQNNLELDNVLSMLNPVHIFMPFFPEDLNSTVPSSPTSPMWSPLARFWYALLSCHSWVQLGFHSHSPFIPPFLAYFPKVVLCNLLTVYLPPHKLLNDWTSLYETWYVYRDTEPISLAYLINPSHHSAYLYMYLLSLPGNGSVEKVTAATNTYGTIKFVATFSIRHMSYQRESMGLSVYRPIAARRRLGKHVPTHSLIHAAEPYLRSCQ
jgi:hypothetical protein